MKCTLRLLLADDVLSFEPFFGKGAVCFENDLYGFGEDVAKGRGATL